MSVLELDRAEFTIELVVIADELVNIAVVRIEADNDVVVGGKVDVELIGGDEEMIIDVCADEDSGKSALLDVEVIVVRLVGLVI